MKYMYISQPPHPCDAMTGPSISLLCHRHQHGLCLLHNWTRTCMEVLLIHMITWIMKMAIMTVRVMY